MENLIGGRNKVPKVSRNKRIYLSNTSVVDRTVSGGASSGIDLSPYYTAEQLDAGQLDNRYYTEVESDQRYFSVSGGSINGDTFLNGLLQISRSASEQLRLGYMAPGISPFISFYEGTTRRAFLQYDVATNSINLKNEEQGVSLSVGNILNVNTNIQITNVKDGTWIAGEELGALNFYGSDLSGNGQGVKSYIKSIARDSYGASFGLSFGVNNGGSLYEGMGLNSVGDLTVVGNIFSRGDGDHSIQLGDGRTDNANSYIDLIGDATYTDYGLRMIRSGGVNAASNIIHRGTGNLQLVTSDAGNISFKTNSTERMAITSGGDVTINNTLSIDSIESSSLPYSSGIFGQGMKIEKNTTTNKYNAELDNLNVRGELNATSYVINQLRGSNGDLLITDSIKAQAGLILNATTNVNYFTVEEINDITVRAYDVIKAQRNGLNDSYSNIYNVYSVDTDNRRIYVADHNAKIFDTANARDFLDFTGQGGATISEYVANVSGIDVTLTNTSQWGKSQALTLTKGVYLIRTDGNSSTMFTNGKARLSFYNASNVRVSDYFEFGTRTLQYVLLTQTIVGGYLKLEVSTGGSSFSVSYLDITLFNANTTTEDVTDHEFLRFGNIFDTNRQSLIYNSVNSSNSPRISLYQGVTTDVLTPAMEISRIGNLGGLTYNNQRLTGTGVYLFNAYVTGNINATSGKIADLTIGKKSISTNGEGGKITIDSDNNQISVTDADDVQRVLIKTNAQTDIAKMEGTAVTFAYSHAAYTTAPLNFRYSIDNTKYYINYLNTAGQLGVYDALNTSYETPVTANSEYTVDLQVTIIPDLVLSLDDNDNTDGLTHQYSMDGSSSVTITATLYNSSSVVLLSKIYTNPEELLNTDDQYVIDIWDKQRTGTITTTKVYLKIQYQITNNFSQKCLTTYYRLVNGHWIFDHEETTSCALNNVTYAISVSKYNLTPVKGLTELSSNGLLTYFDSSHYFKLNTDAANFMESAGNWKHSGELTHNHKISNYNAASNTLSVDDEVIHNSGAAGNIYYTLLAAVPVGKKYVIVNVKNTNIYMRLESGSASYLNGDGTLTTLSTTSYVLVPAYGTRNFLKVLSNIWANN